MNLLLLDDADFVADERAILHGDDPRFGHISTVLDAKVGASLRAGRLGGNMGCATITARNASAIEFTIQLDQPPPAKLPLTILLALPRPKMMRRILRTVAETGVERLVLLNTFRVEKSYWGSPAITPATVRRYFIEGLQQARDTVLPTLEFARRFKPFVEDELSGLIGGQNALVAHPGGAQACPFALNSPCTIAIGPEGGFIDYEIAKLEQAGMRCVQMGPRILRVDTALTSLVARLYS